MPASPGGDGGHGAGAAEWIEDDVAPVTKELDEPVNQFLRERCRVAF